MAVECERSDRLVLELCHAKEKQDGTTFWGEIPVQKQVNDIF
jgi:hypothetical protein